MHLMTQLSILFAICWAGEIIAALILFPLPANIISLTLLFLLLCLKWIKLERIQDISKFLLQNMAFFFVPAGVSILLYLNVLIQNFIPIILICAITTPLVFAVTGWAVQATMRFCFKNNDSYLEDN